VLKWAVGRGYQLDSDHLNCAIIHGHLTLVRWMHEEHLVPFYCPPTYFAAQSGNLSLLQYVVKKGAKIDNDDILVSAARSGSKEMIQWLHDECGLKWYAGVCSMAAKNGHLSLLQYLRSQGCEWGNNTTQQAAEKGHLSVLQWAIENGCPFDLEYDMLGEIIEAGHLDVFQFLHQRDLVWLVNGIQENDFIERAADQGHLSMVKFLYPILKQTRNQIEILYVAIYCQKPIALEMVQWLIEQCTCSLPLNDSSFINERENIRLDVAKYLEEIGLMKKRKE